MGKKKYLDLKNKIIINGYGNDIKMIEKNLIAPCDNYIKFLYEYIWVVINSGMKNQIAVKIYEKVINAIERGVPIINVFKNKNKVKAIEYLVNNIESIYQRYKISFDKIEFLEQLPYMGPATKYHLARNLGIDVCKPDRHLVRISKYYKTTPNQLCKKISNFTGDKIGVVDLILWRAGNLGFI